MLLAMRTFSFMDQKVGEIGRLKESFLLICLSQMFDQLDRSDAGISVVCDIKKIDALSTG